MSPIIFDIFFKLFANILLISGSVQCSLSKFGEIDESQRTCGVYKHSCSHHTRYRTFDGSCNNLIRPEWGSVSMPYGRLLPNSYSDGIYAFPRTSSGEELPNARVLRLAVYPYLEKQDEENTLITMQWGQIVVHDMSLTLGISQALENPNPCCADGKFLDPATTSPRCMPIERPSNDPATVEEGNMCIDFLRTLSTKDQNCTSAVEPANPLSAPTSYLDLSLVYGLNDSDASILRELKDGKLKTITRNGYQYPPQDPNITAACAVTYNDEPCYYTGDVRINQNLQLSLLQVILLREHNNLADGLKCVNPHWDDETLFQEARRILIAMTQHITYYEYLPRILGKENMIREELIYENCGNYINDYDSSVNPSVYTEFSAGAFRYFHTTINGQIKKYTEERKKSGVIRFSDGNAKPSLLENDDNFEGLARGLCTQTQNDNDEKITAEVTNYFFRLNATYGDDVRAIDIQRSRDFGLANYNATRVFCGLSPINTFDDLKVNMSAKNVKKLKKFYKNVEDIELLVAGSLENLVPDTKLGPTFLCIILKQFYNTRVGDRFFFENGDDKKISFTKDQLNSIRKVTLARIMCNNSPGFKKLQRRVFQVISHENPLVPCEEIPSIDLSLWKENP